MSALADVKREHMTRDQITKAACKLSARDFMGLMEHNEVFTEVLDQDNIMDANDGYFNVIVEGMNPGEALLFIDGEFCG
jgi:hypothetical protein